MGKKAGTYSVEDGGYFFTWCKLILGLKRSFRELQLLLHLIITLSCRNCLRVMYSCKVHYLVIKLGTELCTLVGRIWGKERSLMRGEMFLWGGQSVMAEEVGMWQAWQTEQALEEAPLSNDGHDHHFDRGSAWFIDHIIPMCKRAWQ